MAQNLKSRWATYDEDDASDIPRKRVRQGKKRLGSENLLQTNEAEETQHLKQEKQSRTVNLTTEISHSPSRQAKWRKLTPDTDEIRSNGELLSGKLLRFPALKWGKCRSLEEFEKLNDIAEGAYGWVSRAKEKSTGKVVVLKKLKMETANDGIPVTGLREIQTLRGCDHPNILELREVVVGDDTNEIDKIFLVLDFFEHDLKTLLEEMCEPFLNSEIKTLLLQLVSGVFYLHNNWILHRDLKTSNLLLNNRGLLKIADFGMARYFSAPPSNMTQLVVTLWYRAPELLLGADCYDTAVDMWSVGCIFGELLKKEPLLQGKNEADQLSKIFELCGTPTEKIWPGFKRLPNTRHLRFGQNPIAHGSVLRSKFPYLTSTGSSLLIDLLSLDPAQRPSAENMLNHHFFREDPKPKSTEMFPTFPSKAGQEKRRRKHSPNAPIRVKASGDELIDFRNIFGNREEEKGAGFHLKLI